jgi:hypothetical protein
MRPDFLKSSSLSKQLEPQNDKWRLPMKQFTRTSTFALLLLALALPALAGKPIITLNPFIPYVIPAGPDTCGFDVYFAPEPGRPNGGRLIEFANSVILHGPVFVTATNLATSKTINLNISGPVHASFTTNTLVFQGPGTLVLPANLAGTAGLPAVSFAHGRAVLGFHASGNLVSVSFTGTAQDLCQLLQ